MYFVSSLNFRVVDLSLESEGLLTSLACFRKSSVKALGNSAYFLGANLLRSDLLRSDFLTAADSTVSISGVVFTNTISGLFFGLLLLRDEARSSAAKPPAATRRAGRSDRGFKIVATLAPLESCLLGLNFAPGWRDRCGCSTDYQSVH